MKSKIVNLLNKIQSKNPKLATKLAQVVNQSQIDSPSVQIDPSIQKDVQSAVDEIRKSDPNFFKGVSRIVGLTGGPFGQVQSKDPTAIQVNLNKIKQQIQSQMGGSYDPSNPQHQEAFKEAVKRSIAETIAHEHGHVRDFDPEQHKFPGGEGVAEQAERTMMQKLHYDKPIELQAQVAEPSSSGQGVDEYNKTGNDYMAGGTSVIPWETRLEELYKKFKPKCPPHHWDRGGERCLKCGDKDWMT